MARLSPKYLEGYRKGTRNGPGYDHVVADALDRMIKGGDRWHHSNRTDIEPQWRGYGAGFIALLAGVDLSNGGA